VSAAHSCPREEGKKGGSPPSLPWHAGKALAVLLRSWAKKKDSGGTKKRGSLSDDRILSVTGKNPGVSAAKKRKPILSEREKALSVNHY